MYKRKIIPLGLAMLVGFSLTGCGSLENSLVKDPVDISVLKEYTPAEYETRMNTYLLPIMTSTQTILSNNWQLGRGGITKEYSIKIIERTIEDIYQVLRNIRQVTPPETHVQHKEDMITYISDYESTLLEYKNAVETEDLKNMDIKSKRIESHLALLKNLQVVNQGYKF